MMALTSIIILSDAPHNSMEFSTLPKNVQNEISLFAESRFHEFEAKQALELEPYRTTHLMLHIMPEICTDGNKARQSGPWPEYEEQYYCASTPVANWCDGYRNMHKATESVISMPGGYELVASFSCLRIMPWIRRVKDFNISLISVIVTIIVTLMCYLFFSSNTNDEDNNTLDDDEKPDLPPPGRPSTKKKESAAMKPLANLVSRKENFRKRR